MVATNKMNCCSPLLFWLRGGAHAKGREDNLIILKEALCDENNKRRMSVFPKVTAALAIDLVLALKQLMVRDAA
jgi:hypothetical protein